MRCLKRSLIGTRLINRTADQCLSAAEDRPQVLDSHCLVMVVTSKFSHTARLITLVAIALMVAVSGPLFADDSSVLSVEKRAAISAPVQYNRDIRPILSTACFRCHGADKDSREADLRLDDRDDTIADRNDYPVIVPGQPNVSNLILRITSHDESERMPPPEEPQQLSKQEINLLRRWIEQGARYEEHWAFTAPKRPAIPTVEMAEWSRNEIDRFVLASLEFEALRPSPEADKATLIRRVTLSLTGLPPSLEEVDAFLVDSSPKAYETVVDRLLKSQSYGEHMARYWLDAARYADSNGYFTDEERTMWPWRDWVIQAFNKNMPFDQFTIEQLAGDLLPDANQSRRIASGFNRNHMVNNESGSIQEEFRVEYVADRLRTTGTVWMGLTIGCARCHDHKFDPVSQRDFYRLFAFFNNVPEKGIDGSQGNVAPLLRVPTSDQKQALAALDAELATAKNAYVAVEKSIAAGQALWEKKAIQSAAPTPSRDLLIHFPLDDNADDIHVPEDVTFTRGAVGGAAQFNYGKPVTATVDLPLNARQPFSLGAWVYSEKNAGCIVSKTNDNEAFCGFDLSLRKGRLQFHLIHRWKDDAIEVATRDTVVSRRWQHLFVTYDGSGKADGVRVFIDGMPQRLDINVDCLSGGIVTQEPLRIGRRKSSASFEGKIDDLRIYNRVLSDQEVFSLASGQLIRSVAARALNQRDAHLAKQLTKYYVDHHAPAAFRKSRNQLVDLQKKRNAFDKTIPSTMVMQEMEKPREAFLLLRGAYDRHGEVVTAGVPANLGLFPENAPLNRLGFAQWLTSSGHPLTSRVTVNRIWQQFFGTGIVKTTEDFGTQGDWPSHPELLDWLAVEFIESGWDVKHLVRLIVHSTTYRQVSAATPSQFADDPLNRNLARGPRFRLDAESIRDQALAVSGLLVERVGGPSFNPYPPPGLWKSVSYDKGISYEPSTGDDRYRRSLYTYWKRQSPPPNMLTFDAGTRETCSVRRSRTNTPLQALVLMNDPVFIEAARQLALRTLTESPKPTTTERARLAFRLATARYPDADELRVLINVYKRQLLRFESSPQTARQLIKGENSGHPPAELAAWTTVSNLILCLDETITRK